MHYVVTERGKRGGELLVFLPFSLLQQDKLICKLPLMLNAINVNCETDLSQKHP